MVGMRLGGSRWLAAVAAVALIEAVSVGNPVHADVHGNGDNFEGTLDSNPSSSPKQVASSWWSGSTQSVTQRYGCTLALYQELDAAPAWCPYPYNGGWHQGIDIGISQPTTLYSRVEGTVADFHTSCLQMGCALGYLAIRTGIGQIVYLLHGSPNTPFNSVGQPVHVGDSVYTTGNNGYSSGYHLHFEVHKSIVGQLQVPTGPGDDINPEQWLVGTLQVDGLQGDVNGDGLTDLVAVNEDSVFVTLSTGSGFQAPNSWWNAPIPPSPPGVPPYGARATLLGDVTGNGKADIVAVNDNSVWVMLSTGSSFSAPVSWSSNTPFFGTRATLLADIRGIGRADLVAVNDTSTWVMLSNGSTSFGTPVLWSSTPFYGTRATLLGDVTGDRKADLVAVNDGATFVMPSNGAGFDQPQSWSSTPFYGTRATLVGDVNNNGQMDLIAVNENNVWVMLSIGSAFGPPGLWLNTSSPPPYGTRATFLGSEVVSRWADLVAVNDGNTYVMVSGYTSFSAPAQWSTTAFYGSHGTL